MQRDADRVLSPINSRVLLLTPTWIWCGRTNALRALLGADSQELKGLGQAEPLAFLMISRVDLHNPFQLRLI